MPKVAPQQNESPFGFHEFFFSTTDSQGVIRYGNDVFVRVSGYPKEEILGAPHSLVRHPDMPKAVFKIFWDMLKSGKPIGAYVKNLSANGSYYWVFAFAFPIADGFLSIRFKPSSPLFKVVQEIYREVRTLEAQNGDVLRTEQLLLQKIREHGFDSYEAFMVEAVVAELKSRDAHAKDLGAITSTAETNRQGASIADTTRNTLGALQTMFDRARGFQSSNEMISGTVGTLDEGFRHLKFVSLNMTVAAAKFGKLAASLSVVAQEFSAAAAEITGQLNILGEFTQKVSEIIAGCTLRISALNCQMLMVDFFVKEALQQSHASAEAFAEMSENKKDFSGLFKEYATKMGEEVASLNAYLADISKTIDAVSRLVTGLEMVRQVGAIESARADDVKSAFRHYLEEMHKFVTLLRTATASVSAEITALRSHCAAIVSDSGKIAGSVEEIFGLAERFAQATREPAKLADIPILRALERSS